MISTCKILWRETPRESDRTARLALAVNYATSTQPCKRRPGHPQRTAAHSAHAECVGVYFGSVRPLDPSILTNANRNSSIELHFAQIKNSQMGGGGLPDY